MRKMMKKLAWNLILISVLLLSFQFPAASARRLGDHRYVNPSPAFPNLELLNLKFNQLTSPIPETIRYLSKLQFLDLNRNHLNGTIPLSLANLTQLYELDLSQNDIIGILYPRLFPDGSDEPKTSLIGIKYLVLQGMLLGGIIPNEIGNLKQLTVLTLYQNSFYGSIPPSLGNCTHLNILSLTVNNLLGAIPPTLGTLTNLTEVYLFMNNLSGPLPQGFENRSFTMLVISDNNFIGHLPPQIRVWEYPNLTYMDLSYNRLQDIIDATGNFAKKYCIGEGALGKVYKLILPREDKVFAIKKLVSEADTLDIESIKAFKSEIKALTETCHRFGTARFLKPDSSIWITFVSTYGYAAPELAYIMVVTEKIDVYSFGVLAIEVLMGEHLGELISYNRTSGMNQINFKEILDPRLSSTTHQKLKKLALIWHLALQCLQTNSHARPTM
ncbi:MDIS1-interacting receptor like kinase 2-like [Neltuma alba]|uniref:MDIS1-interacting receptor like kinase 2-like n=1 Tax=Neltuma alba TaxID=207710 RepID=UPI0010A53742|nr:MDIS1-interacting receptor like kinase 2-like [Prosopis alba]